jgi:N-acyl-D-aspartate/D-glutamate deacylase
MTPDIIIRNGTVFDGLGNPGAISDVAVSDGKILEIGLIETDGTHEIDATGLYVAPGFIDIHSHSDFTLLVDPRAISSISQGVTLEVIGNCGHGCFPIVDKLLARGSIYGISDLTPLTWSTASEYLNRLEDAGPAINVATLVPNGQLRQAVIGLEDRPAAPDEIMQMRRHLDEGLESGAFGLSTGLEYPIETGTGREEIEALLEPLHEKDFLYATHTRKRDMGALDAVEEALETAGKCGVRLQISHLLPRGGSSDCEACVEAVENARTDGQDVSFDMHTRSFSMTFLHAMLPPWALTDGLSGLSKLIENDVARARILYFPSIVNNGNWDKVTLLDNDIVPEFSRLDFVAIGRRMDMSPGDAALELLCRSANASSPLMVIRPVYSESDQELAFANDLCVPGSDATALCPDGPLAGSAFHGAYSWASWFYRFAVNERKFLTPQAAIYKLTGQPASILKLQGRGVLAKNAYADISIFDPEKFGERTTLWNPNQIATGMKHVIVNGKVALDNSEITSHRAGRVIRKAEQ